MTETALLLKGLLKPQADKIFGLIYPLRCPVCDRPVWPKGERICLYCLKNLKPISDPICEKCGKKLMSETGMCHDCKERPHSFTRCRSAFEYSSAREMIYRFKYSGRREYARIFAELSERVLAEYIYAGDFDCIVPVPVSRRRFLKRGYNQAGEFGRQLSEVTGIPFCDGAIIRSKNTSPLKLLNPSERQKNLKNAFKKGKNVVKSKRILLVDDIYTTGATMDACTEVLLQNGAACVYGLTLASGTGV